MIKTVNRRQLVTRWMTDEYWQARRGRRYGSADRRGTINWEGGEELDSTPLRRCRLASYSETKILQNDVHRPLS